MVENKHYFIEAPDTSSLRMYELSTTNPPHTTILSGSNDLSYRTQTHNADGLSLVDSGPQMAASVVNR